LFATIVEFSGITTQEINNSISFYDLLSDTNTNERAFVYTERSSNGLSYAIINSSYKLIVHDNGSQEFYNLSPDPYENNDLIGTSLSSSALSAKNDLVVEANNIRMYFFLH